MATQATNIPMPSRQASFGLRARLTQWVGAFWQALEDQANNGRFATTIRLLEAKSDAELADLGVTRDEIPQYAMRQMYYI